MPSTKLPTAVVTYFLTLAFFMAAVSKLAPQHPMYEEMLEKAPSWVKVLQLEAYMDADLLLVCIGIAELSFALLLPFISVANYALMLMMCGALYTHFRLDGDKFTVEAIPAAFLLTLLIILAGLKASSSKPETTLLAQKRD